MFNIVISLITLFTTLLCPYLCGIVLEPTVLGRLFLLRKIKKTLVRQLFLGCLIFSILFFAGYLIPQISIIFDGLINKYDIEGSLGNATKAYIFIVGVGTFPFSASLLIIIHPLDYLLIRRNDSDKREEPLFHD